MKQQLKDFMDGYDLGRRHGFPIGALCALICAFLCFAFFRR